MIRSALDGSLAQVASTIDPNFGLAVPQMLLASADELIE